LHESRDIIIRGLLACLLGHNATRRFGKTTNTPRVSGDSIGKNAEPNIILIVTMIAPGIMESWGNCIGPNGQYHKHKIERYVYRKDKTKITVTARTSVLDCLPVDAEMILPLAVTD